MLDAADRERIRREGPISFADFQAMALYDEADGFFASSGGAGRMGADFVTSPEVGSLFGALVARHLDEVWRRLGAPDPFVVVEAGAGRGRLAADVLRAEPECAPALRYVLVERSARLRAEQREHLALEPVDEALGPFAHRSDPDEPLEVVPGAGPIVSGARRPAGDGRRGRRDRQRAARQPAGASRRAVGRRLARGARRRRRRRGRSASSRCRPGARPSWRPRPTTWRRGPRFPDGRRLPVPIATRGLARAGRGAPRPR